MNRRKRGNEKEKVAAEFLKKQGYTIITMNFYFKGGEIDIIAREGEYLVFIEVKYRTSGSSGLPEEAVTPQKMQRISYGASYYMLSHHIPDSAPVRFDVVAVDNEGIRLHRNAFLYAG